MSTCICVRICLGVIKCVLASFVDLEKCQSRPQEDLWYSASVTGPQGAPDSPLVTVYLSTNTGRSV